MINLRDPRWQALGVLLALYVFIVTSVVTIPGLQKSLFGTFYGWISFGILLLVPVVVLISLRLLDQKQSPRLSRKDRKLIEAAITDFRRLWIAACRQNEPRFLWNATTEEAYFDMEEQIRQCHEQLREYSCTNMTLARLEPLNAYATKREKAVMRTDETWTYEYSTGQMKTEDISIRYFLRREDLKWKISDFERFRLTKA